MKTEKYSVQSNYGYHLLEGSHFNPVVLDAIPIHVTCSVMLKTPNVI